MFGRLARWFSPLLPPANPIAWPAAAEPPPSDAMQLGEAAQRLLEDPVLILALDRVQAKLTETWRNTAPGEEEAREAAYRLYWASEQFRGELKVMLGNARAAARRAA